RRERIAILPIDRCQGQEADVVVVSFVRTLPKPRPNAGRWLQDVRRLNVAFTRARHSLVLIGNLPTLIALRGDADGERLLAHLGRCVAEHPEHQIEQLQGL
ncbi:MAG: AAA domain-containing protein, partial [Proteobacteria bacterium]|nr:AAA domain-containing protein [Pseudomonadota bacterium]